MKSVTDIQTIILDTLPNQKENTKNETQTPIAQVLHKIQYQELSKFMLGTCACGVITVLD